jgi:quinol monooxygenase YgiN
MLIASLVALCALTLEAQAQNVVSSAQSPQIYWIYSATVNPGRLDDFKQPVAEAVANTAKEPNTLEYQYNLSPDQKSIVERYVDSAAVVVHVNGFKEKFGKRFVEDVTGTRFAVYGPVSAEAKEAMTVLEIFGPNGEYWTQRESNDGNGDRCIMGAVRTDGNTAVSCERSGNQFQRRKTQ